VTAARSGGVELPPCATPDALDCIDGATVRLGPASLDGAEIQLEAGAASGTVRVTAPGLAAVELDLR
jgi:hypothetical protein